jgi:methanethiol S-methyltransferase
LVPRLVILISALAGSVSLILFGAFLFWGPLSSVDLGLSPPAVLVWDGLLSMAFFVQHSGMVRRPFRARLSGLVPSRYNDATFTIVSGLVLALVVGLWQTTGSALFELRGAWRWMTRGIFLLGVAGMGWSAYALRSFDLFGWRAIRKRLSRKPTSGLRFAPSGPYLWVRHPQYSLSVLLMWSFPDMTADRLLLNLLWTAWICVGTILEERDLAADFGDDYRRYQTIVPVLLPWKGGVDRRLLACQAEVDGRNRPDRTRTRA